MTDWKTFLVSHHSGSGQPPRRLLAYVDESIRRVDSSTVHYLMAGAVLGEHQCDDVRATLRPLARRTARRIHWRDEEPNDKELIAKSVLGTGVESIVVVGAMTDPRKQERARAQVLKHLLYELDQQEVAHATLESRHAERNRHDITSIGQFRNAGYVSRRLTVSHAKPLNEPLLWLPDIVAGAAGDHLCGVNTLYQMLHALVDHHDIGTI